MKTMNWGCRQLVATPLLRPKRLQNVPSITLVSRLYYSSVKGKSDLVDKGPTWRKQFTITTESPATLEPNEIVSKIKEVQTTFNLGRHSKSLEKLTKTVVILSTPSFATWLENGPFVSNILEAIFPTSQNTTVVETVLGVVDGLAPANVSNSDGDTITPTEGFGVCVMLRESEKDCVPGLRQNVVAPGSNPTQGSIITIRVSDSGTWASSDITVPMANTTFRNGRRSTLLEVRWVRNSSEQSFTKTKSDELEIWTPGDLLTGSLFENSTNIPLTPITETRRIASGLGNIVRTLADTNGDEIPASKELEASVVSYLSSRGLPEQTVGVWALVFPAEVYESRKSSWTEDHPTRVWNAIQQGASLHRLLSGGGGWGIKAGLLSLDPETRFGVADARYDFSQVGSALDSDAGQAKALGQIAKPGSYVQFLIAHQPLHQNASATSSPKEVEPSEPPKLDSNVQSVILGCIPSTIDDIPLPPSETRTEEAKTNITVAYNQLSILSEEGLYLRRQRRLGPNFTSTSFTRLDVPGAAIRGQTKERKPKESKIKKIDR